MYKYLQVSHTCVQYTVKLYLQNTHLMCENENWFKNICHHV